MCLTTVLGDRLAVGHLRLADGGVDLELAEHAVDQHLEVQLAHAGDDGLAGLLVGADLEGRVLLGERVEGLGHLVLVDLGLGLDGDVDDRLGELERLEHDRVRRVAERVAGLGVLEADAGDDVAGVDGVDVVLRSLACISSRRPMRSLLPVRALRTWSPLSSVPL